jgi:hypothetical protein
VFWKLDLFLSSGEGRGPTEYVTLSLHLRIETDPVSGTQCFVLLRKLNEGQGPKTQ